MLLKRVLLAFILLVSTGFFGIKYLSLSEIRLLQFLTVAFMIASVVLVRIYGNGFKPAKKRFITPIIIILIGVFLSSLVAHSFHNQDFLITFWAQSPMYWFIFYFFLDINKYSRDELEKALLMLAVAYSVFHIIQFVIYPTVLFDVRMDDDPYRNTIRIFLPGFAFLIIGYYLALSKFFTTNRMVYLMMVLLFFSINILRATRQFLFVLLLVTIYAILFSKKVKSRTLIVTLSILSAIPLFFLFQDIFMSMIELSTAAAQGEDLSANARETAYVYFITDFFPADIAYIFGNGMDHMRSDYGMWVAMLKQMGLYQADIGMIGEYTIYGAFFVLGAFLAVFKLLKLNYKPELNFIRYYALSIILLIPLWAFFTSTSAISILCILFYLIDFDLNNKVQNKLPQ